MTMDKPMETNTGQVTDNIDPEKPFGHKEGNEAFREQHPSAPRTVNG